MNIGSIDDHGKYLKVGIKITNLNKNFTGTKNFEFDCVLCERRETTRTERRCGTMFKMLNNMETSGQQYAKQMLYYCIT